MWILCGDHIRCESIVYRCSYVVIVQSTQEGLDWEHSRLKKPFDHYKIVGTFYEELIPRQIHFR